MVLSLYTALWIGTRDYRSFNTGISCKPKRWQFLYWMNHSLLQEAIILFILWFVCVSLWLSFTFHLNSFLHLYGTECGGMKLGKVMACQSNLAPPTQPPHALLKNKGLQNITVYSFDYFIVFYTFFLLISHTVGSLKIEFINFMLSWKKVSYVELQGSLYLFFFSTLFFFNLKKF